MINNAVLVGRMGNDPEMRYSQNGTPITKFRLAVTRPRRAEAQEDETDWLNIVCFGKTAEFVAQYLDKGSLVGVEGRIQTRQYEQDGRQVWWTEIAANNVQALESKQEAERRRASHTDRGAAPRQAPAQQGRPAQPAAPAEPDDFEIDESNDPFGDQ